MGMIMVRDRVTCRVRVAARAVVDACIGFGAGAGAVAWAGA